MKSIVDFANLVKTYITSQLSGKAPTNHASTATTYGVGNATNYGHVKVDSNPTASSTNAVASGGVKSALDGKAPTNHASTTTTYGVASETNYGHVKIVDYVSMGSTEAVTSNAVHNEIYGPMKIDQRLFKIELIQPKITASLSNIISNINNNGSKNLMPPIMSTYGGVNALNKSNQLYKATSNGVTFTLNDDGSVSASGTATNNFGRVFFGITYLDAGTYMFAGISETGASSSTYHVSLYLKGSKVDAYNLMYSDFSFTLAERTMVSIRLYINQNYTVDKTFKFMFCRKSDYDLDPTWEPYAKTNQQLTKDTDYLVDNTEANGAVNMCKNNATTQIINGITFTVNDDGTVTADGTATANADLDLNPGFIEKANVLYRLSGGPSGGSQSTWLLYERNSPNALDTGDGVLFSRTEDVTASVRIRIYAGQTVSNLIFKPMISVASYDGDYVPYAKSNKELTDDVNNLFGRFGQDFKLIDVGSFSNSSKTITVNTTIAGLLATYRSGNAEAYDSLHMVSCTPTEVPAVKTIASASNVTLDLTQAGKITVTNSGRGGVRVYLLLFKGTATIS